MDTPGWKKSRRFRSELTIPDSNTREWSQGVRIINRLDFLFLFFLFLGYLSEFRDGFFQGTKLGSF